MIKFFNTLQAMHQFTLSLDTHSDTLECQHCLKKDQFVSHGFIYKKQHQNDKQAIGKRIFCSNRHTHTEYLAVIPEPGNPFTALQHP
ncbi:hypothetical protein [sulfur-oxidizing endosymbiont of Gigantopelta aegis]|uniref:hypothetical protein n=1 Tax=sulfur-oxidizing endosymbiont of Gigantopelta aegis TaxID=2794934 RepID=UPI0018DDD5CD|nr:hypothetical protein [sulfur-oxidizing endosymbiont of Gigantopelta aegis]